MKKRCNFVPIATSEDDCMRHVLLIGFEPYSPFKVNPSAEIVKRLDGKIIRESKVEGHVLSPIFRAFQTLERMIKKTYYRMNV